MMIVIVIIIIIIFCISKAWHITIRF